MKNICILGAGGSSINIIKKIAETINIEQVKNKDSINIKYGLISPSLEDIHRAQEYGLDIIINEQTLSNKDVYEPIIKRKITREIEYLAIGKNTCKGLSAFASIETAEKAFYESEKEIDIFLKQLLEDIDLVIFVATFGGGSGTGIIPLLAQKTQDMKIKSMYVIGKPFEFEGEERLNSFNNGMLNLKKITNEIIIIDSKASTNSLINAFKERDLEFAKKVKENIQELN